MTFKNDLNSWPNNIYPILLQLYVQGSVFDFIENLLSHWSTNISSETNAKFKMVSSNISKNNQSWNLFIYDIPCVCPTWL